TRGTCEGCRSNLATRQLHNSSTPPRPRNSQRPIPKTFKKRAELTESLIHRREAIRRAALLAGVAIAPAWLDFAARAQTPAGRTYLTAPQRPTHTGAAARLPP